MATEIFRRVEKKYLAPMDTYRELLPQLSRVMVPDRYNKDGQMYTISNLYYDTEDSYFIRTSLEKPYYKEKVRMRSYGVPEPEETVYLEVKKKIGGVVSKRRSGIKLEDAYQFMDEGILRPGIGKNKQVLREIQVILESRPLVPKTYLAYDRVAFFHPEMKSLRITFDHNIRARRTDLHLESGCHGNLLLRDSFCVMEVKTEGALPLWLTQLLTEYQLTPASFSKYGAEHLRYQQSQLRKEGIHTCLKPYLQEALMPLSPSSRRYLAS